MMMMRRVRKVGGELRELAEERMSVKVIRRVQGCEQFWGRHHLMKPGDENSDDLFEQST